MPPPEAIWMALGLIAWAVAMALAPTVRGRFMNALEMLSEQHEARWRVVSFPPPSLKTGDMSHATRIAIAWVRSILDEFRAARG